MTTYLARVMVVAALVGAAWFGFLWLVGDQDISESPALIMVWGSAAVLLVAVFPRLLSRIKKIKVKDVEVELDREVQAAAEKPPIVADGAPPILGEKRGPEELNVLLRSAASDRSRPVVLDVDVEHGRRISIPALHFYVFLLSLLPNPSVVAFGTSRHRSGLEGVIDATDWVTSCEARFLRLR